jgi:uncharacterized protein YndB with AHSA1/START domain
MPDAFRITSMVPGLPERVYSAWLDSGAHAAFTGASAKIDPTIGGKFAVLDGYVHGRTVDLLPGRRIVQTWRTKEFPGAAPDSRLEVQFETAEGATRITVMHSGIPQGLGERFKQTWTARYFHPMRGYFGRLLLGGPVKAGAIRGSVPTPAVPAKKPAAPPTKPAAAKTGSHKQAAAKKKPAHNPRAAARSHKAAKSSAKPKPKAKKKGRR